MPDIRRHRVTDLRGCSLGSFFSKRGGPKCLVRSNTPTGRRHRPFHHVARYSELAQRSTCLGSYGKYCLPYCNPKKGDHIEENFFRAKSCSFALQRRPPKAAPWSMVTVLTFLPKTTLAVVVDHSRPIQNSLRELWSLLSFAARSSVGRCTRAHWEHLFDTHGGHGLLWGGAGRSLAGFIDRNFKPRALPRPCVHSVLFPTTVELILF